MGKTTLKSGATNRSEYVLIQDSTSTTGGGLTGLVYNSAGLTCYYVTERGTPTALSLVTLTDAQASYSSGGFVVVNATYMPGLYRLDLPSGAFTGNKAVVYLRGATNMVPCVLEYEVVAFDPHDTVRLGLTAMPNVASGSAGAIITSGTGTAQLSTSSGLVTAGTVSDKTGYSLATAPPTSATISTDVWAAATRTLTSGGGGGSSTVTLRMGPYTFGTPDTRAGESLSTMVGAAHDVEFQLIDVEGNAIDTTGATVTAKVYSLAGTLVDTYTATAIYAAGGRGYFALDTTVTATAGTYRVTITRSTGATDVTICGPVTLHVREV